MNLEFLTDYIVLIPLGLCLTCGYIIKNSLNFISNKHIPLIVGILGVFFNMWLNGFIITPEILLGGLISGLASTGLYELKRNEGFRNLTNKDISNKEG